MDDTQELQRLALVPNLMDRSLSMHDTDDCIADLRHLNWDNVYILTKITITYIVVLQIIPKSTSKHHKSILHIRKPKQSGIT